MVYNCIVCNENNVKEVFEVEELQLGIGDKFNYQLCQNCSSLQIQNPPQDLSKYYPNEAYYSFNLDLKINNKADALRRIKASYLLFNQNKFLGKLLSIGYKMPDYLEWMKYSKTKFDDSILDIGTGNGSLLARLFNVGFTNLTGIDPFINESKNYGAINIEKKSVFEVERKYKTIMLHHALEHMFEPLKVMQKVYDILEPKGSCLVRIPIMGNYGWQHYKTFWCGVDAPRHIFIPSEKGLRELVEAAGFTIEKFVYDSSDYVVWCSEQYQKHIPLHDARSYNVNKNAFSKAEISKFKTDISNANENNNGDTAAVYLRKH